MDQFPGNLPCTCLSIVRQLFRVRAITFYPADVLPVKVAGPSKNDVLALRVRPRLYQRLAGGHR